MCFKDSELSKKKWSFSFFVSVLRGPELPPALYQHLSELQPLDTHLCRCLTHIHEYDTLVVWMHIVSCVSARALFIIESDYLPVWQVLYKKRSIGRPKLSCAALPLPSLSRVENCTHRSLKLTT